MLPFVLSAYNSLDKNRQMQIVAGWGLFAWLRAIVYLFNGNFLEWGIIAPILLGVTIFLIGLCHTADVLGDVLGEVTGLLIVQYLTLFFPLLPWLLTTLVGFGLIVALWLFCYWLKIELAKLPSSRTVKPKFEFNFSATPVSYAKQRTPHLLYGMTCCLLFHA